MNLRALGLLVLFLSSMSAGWATDVVHRSPEEILKLLEAGKAVLVDVREEAEWKESGVAEPAVLLAMSDLRGDRTKWTSFLEANKDKELIMACRSGNRSGQVAATLVKEGYNATNGGGFRDWKAAKLPTRKVE